MSRKSRRQFGSVRRHVSSDYRASYWGPDGQSISLGTFPSYVEADPALADVQLRLRSGTWIDPRQSVERSQTYLEPG